MAATHDTVNTALSLIDAIPLPRPAGALLASFVKDALNPNLAAQYVTNWLSSGDAHSLVRGWIYINSFQYVYLITLHDFQLS